MKVTFVDMEGGVTCEIETDGDAVVLTYDHLWDKTGDSPVLIAHFDSTIDRWVDENGYLWTDVVIGD